MRRVEIFNTLNWEAVTLHSSKVRWGEAEPDPKSVWLEDRIEETHYLSLPTVYFQGLEDGVNPRDLSEDLHRKFSGPFERIALQNVGHFQQREDADTVTRELAPFLEAAPKRNR
ncbi:alpha/beta hydrolase [Rhizobium sp. S152]|uniref:alpha/beta fold hydrolase n=1 Tax=Rhizobium sp. S152 TaxID=3055038 RepID=UPI0025A975CB|nr:alpha/beta hydrolase [Rhizobium sp. S152]MDM9627762.1 alpha/beta hydrolase [Rhizobium sp. S152]